MQHHFDTNPADLRVGIAPCIGMPVYEVGDEVVTAVHEAFGTLDQLVTYHPASGKPHFNLKSANRQSLIQAGVRPNHIEIAPYCSYDDDDWFYSHRRDKGITGRFGSGLMLLPQ
jgi:copper oxidase (laccase) domain-containing protein